MYDSFLLFSLFLSVKFNIALPVFLVSLVTADLVKVALISLASFGITAITFFAFSRKLGFEIKIHELFVYYFFYSVVWIIIIVMGYLQVIFLRKSTVSDWRT